MEETRSELQRDNRALSDRVEVLELRQRNRQLMRHDWKETNQFTAV